MSTVVVVDPASETPIVLVEQIQGPAGGGALSVTGTGFVHITGSVLDSAARAVNLASADVTSTLPVASGGTSLMATGSVGQALMVVSAGMLGYASPQSGLFSVQNVNHASGTVAIANGTDYWADPTSGSVALTLPTGLAAGSWFGLKIVGVPSGGSPVTITVAGGGSKGLEIPIGEGATAPVTLNTFTTTTLVFNKTGDQGAGYVWICDGSNNWRLR